MFLRVLRGTLLLAASAVMIPYTIAVVCNILHGWPQCRFKYRRALNPRKVFRLNYVLFQMLRDKTKYLPLYLKWNKFYRNAHPRTLHKVCTVRVAMFILLICFLFTCLSFCIWVVPFEFVFFFNTFKRQSHLRDIHIHIMLHKFLYWFTCQPIDLSV